LDWNYAPSEFYTWEYFCFDITMMKVWRKGGFARRNIEKCCCSQHQWYVVAAGRMQPVAASFPATTWRTSYNFVGGWASTRIFSSKATISVKLGAINFNVCELSRGGLCICSIGRLSTRWDLSAHSIKLMSGD